MHISPRGPNFPRPHPHLGIFFGENGEMGRDGDENYPQIEMGMGMGGPLPIPISPFSPQLCWNGDGDGDGDGGEVPHPHFPISPNYI